MEFNCKDFSKFFENNKFLLKVVVITELSSLAPNNSFYCFIVLYITMNGNALHVYIFNDK